MLLNGYFLVTMHISCSLNPVRNFAKLVTTLHISELTTTSSSAKIESH